MAINPDSLKNLRRGNKRGPNKNSAILKDALIEAAELAGGEGGMTAYLQRQADESPAAFLSLLGKVITLQADLKVKGNITVMSGVPRADE